MKWCWPGASPKDPDIKNNTIGTNTKPCLANLMAAVVVEQYSQEEMEKPWKRRQGIEAIMTKDEDLHGSPVFVLNAGKGYGLKIVLKHKHKGYINHFHIQKIRLQPEDGYVHELEFTSFKVTEFEEEIRAGISPDLHESRRLPEVTPENGDLKERYIQLEIAIDLISHTEYASRQTLRTRIFCKVVPSNEPPLTLHEFFKGEECWMTSPKWIQDAAYGTVTVVKAPYPFTPKLLNRRRLTKLTKLAKIIIVTAVAKLFPQFGDLIDYYDDSEDE